VTTTTTETTTTTDATSSSSSSFVRSSARRVVEVLRLSFCCAPAASPARTAPVWVPLEDRVLLALLLAKGYAALDSRPYGGSLALALYPLKETE